MAYKYSPSSGSFYPDDIAYSSIPSDAIETTDAVFNEWCAAAVGSTISVSGQTITINPPPTPSSAQIKAALISYAASKRETVSQGGITVTGCEIDTSTAGQSNLNSLAITAQGNPTQSFTWVQSSGNQTLTSTQIISLQSAMTSFITSAWVAYSAVVSSIKGGSITTNAQIDAYAWPTNS